MLKRKEEGTMKLLRILTLGIIFSFVILLPKSADAAIHKVTPGQSLFTIGQIYGLTPVELQQANRLSTPTIYAGQTLYIPEKETIDLWHQVQKGETLYQIAQRYRIGISEITSANPGINSEYLYIGQVLKLKIPLEKSTTWNLSQQDIRLMAQAVHSEARGEILEGQVAVAAVILNRIKSSHFPASVSGILFQTGAFTAVQDGQFFLPPNETAFKAVDLAIKGWDPSGGALFYFNPAVATNKWVWSRPVVNKIGNHIFTL